MQNNITNKQNHGDVSWPEAQSCLQIKEFPLSSYSESVSKEDETLGSFAR